jgi:hypothetical protein
MRDAGQHLGALTGLQDSLSPVDHEADAPMEHMEALDNRWVEVLGRDAAPRLHEQVADEHTLAVSVRVGEDHGTLASDRIAEDLATP